MFYYCFVSADTWPEVFDDSNARKDWGWKHEYDIKKLCEIMFEKLKPVYQKTEQPAQQHEKQQQSATN